MRLLVIAFVLLQITTLCSTVYLHRYLAHRSISLHWLVALLMHGWIAVMTGINVRNWIAVHRKHHAFTDTDHDPTSPWVYGFWVALFGSIYLYYRTGNDSQTIRRYANQYKPDWIDRIPGLGYRGLSGLVILFIVMGLDGVVVWFLHIVAYVALFSVLNSVSHMYGKRNESNSKATNSLILAVLAMGEGWHHNHHTRPGSGKFGWIDFGWLFISFLIWMRLAHLKQRASEE